MLMRRFMAVVIYIIAAFLALKSFSELSSGKAEIEGSWEWNVGMLIASLTIAIGAWFVDRHYCRKKPEDK